MFKNFILHRYNKIARLINFYLKNRLVRFMLLIPIKKIVRFFFNNRIESYLFLIEKLKGKHGLEIGGPSEIFSQKGLCPIYTLPDRLDNLNFSKSTLWNDNKERDYSYNNFVLGKQYIGEATDIEKITDIKYDFVCSSHFIQHSANPIKVLKGIKNILKDDGILIFVIPYSINTFDHKRNITTLEHMIEDYNNDIGEDDRTHIDEIIFNHDLGRDDGVSDYNSFVNRCKNNYLNRGCHQHVFNEYNFFELLSYLKFNINKVELWYPYHMIFICVKNDDKHEKNNFHELVNLKMNGPWYLKPHYPIS